MTGGRRAGKRVGIHRTQAHHAPKALYFAHAYAQALLRHLQPPYWLALVRPAARPAIIYPRVRWTRASLPLPVMHAWRPRSLRLKLQVSALRLSLRLRTLRRLDSLPVSLDTPQGPWSLFLATDQRWLLASKLLRLTLTRPGLSSMSA
jgi:hypothetical protein